MLKIEEKMELSRPKTISLVIALANKMMNELGVKEKINEEIRWDKKHWGISPGGLIKALIVSTFTEIRVPLTHLEERLYELDMTYIIGEDTERKRINSFNVGRALERLGEGDYNGIYEQVSLTAFQQYEIPMTRAHSDTTTVSFYGEYDISNMKLTEKEKAEILKLEKGYNKDGRPESKQVVVGQVTNEYGIPLMSRTLDGATSDVDWNREAITYLEGLKREGFSHGIYVADSKTVTEELVIRMTKKESWVSFVSRCPANFHNKMESRMISQAYRQNNWEDIGAVGSGKKASQYRISSSIEYYRGSMLRLVVMESSVLKEQAVQSLEKERNKLAPIVKELEKKEFSCRADAEKEYKRFMKRKEWKLFFNKAEITETVREKWPAGRRSAETRPTMVTVCKITITQIEQKEQPCRQYLQNGSCIVLISNVLDETVTDRNLVETYKGQQVVENSFRQFKGPNLASVIYLKNPVRICALTMVLSLALLLRALIQYRLRDGLKKHEADNPGVPIMAGWAGRPLKNPTYKLLYEHSINCYYKCERRGQYSFMWPFVETRQIVESLLSLMGVTVKTLLQ